MKERSLLIFGSEISDAKDFPGVWVLRQVWDDISLNLQIGRWRKEISKGWQTVLELSMVVFVYDRLRGAGVCRLAELALGKFIESDVKARAKSVCNSELFLLVSLS